jgi:hypothetical protein
MSVINEQQGSLPVQPKGVDLVIAEHDYNPTNGHYEPELFHAPTNVLGIGASGGVLIMTVPLTVNARWIYGLVITDGGSGRDYIQLVDTAGPTLKFNIITISGGNYTLMSDPEAPIFTLPAGDGLIALCTNPQIVDVIYIDK